MNSEYRVVRFRNADLRKRTPAQIGRHYESRNARDIGPISRGLQIGHQPSSSARWRGREFGTNPNGEYTSGSERFNRAASQRLPAFPALPENERAMGD
jgi:hypothetical protein